MNHLNDLLLPYDVTNDHNGIVLQKHFACGIMKFATVDTFLLCMVEENQAILPHQIGISAVFINMRKFYLTYPILTCGKDKI